MNGDIVFDIAARLLGFPQAPDWPLPRPVEHAFGVALRSRWSLVPTHPHGKHTADIQAWGYSSE